MVINLCTFQLLTGRGVMYEVPTTGALQTQRELDCDDTPTEQEDAACNRVFVVLQFRRCADWQLPSCKTRRVHLAPYYRLNREIVTNSQSRGGYRGFHRSFAKRAAEPEKPSSTDSQI